MLFRSAFLDCAPLGEASHIAPPYTKMGETLFRISSQALILYVDHLALSLDQHIVFLFTCPNLVC